MSFQLDKSSVCGDPLATNIGSHAFAPSPDRGDGDHKRHATRDDGHVVAQ